MQIINLTSIQVMYILKNTITKYLKISLDETFLILNAAFKKYTPKHVYSWFQLVPCMLDQYLFDLQVVMAPTVVCINS